VARALDRLTSAASGSAHAALERAVYALFRDLDRRDIPSIEDTVFSDVVRS